MTHVEATAMFNGARHRGPPSMLYGDGAVRSDATRRIDPAADDLPLPRYEGVWAYTWPDWNDTFGTYHHLVPYCEFEDGSR